MNYDIIGLCSICSAAAMRRPSCGSGLAATLPRLCRPGPALAEPLSPDPLRLSDRHHLGSPAVAPHPEAWMVKNPLYQVFQLSSVGIVSAGPRHLVGEDLQPLQPPELS